MIELRRFPKSWRRDGRLADLEKEQAEARKSRGAMEDEYQAKHAQLVAARNQVIGGIRECEYLLRAWSMRASGVGGGNIPTAAQRAADPATALQVPSGDNKQPALATVE